MLIKDFGQSKVYEWGIGVYHPEGYMYDIERDRLTEDWMLQMGSKTWVDMASFENALRFARSM